MLKINYTDSKTFKLLKKINIKLQLISLIPITSYTNNNKNPIINTLDLYFKDIINLNKKSTSSYLFILSLFLTTILKNKIDKSIYVSIDNYIKYNYPFILFLKSIRHIFKKSHLLKRLKISLKEVMWVFFILLKFKDIFLFRSWLKHKFIVTKLRSHKVLISIIKYIIKTIIPQFLSSFSLLGILFCVKGKIGSSGSSKKRMISFNYGVVSKNKKKIKTNFSNLSIKTSTGVLGISFGIFY